MNRALRSPLTWIAAASVIYVLVFLVGAAQRVAFPYDVEWMEGGVLMQAARILRGEAAYPPPSATFVPFLYPPLYPAAIALVGSAFGGGVSYAIGRSISLVASITSAATCATCVFRVTKRWELSLLTLGLEAALVGFSGSFHDLVRGDALAMALVVVAAALAMRGNAWRMAIAGVLLAGACFAKQTAFVAGLGVVAGVALTRERRHLVIIASTALVVGALAFWWLESRTGGWFSFYLLRGHRSHRFYRDNFGFYFFRDALHLAPIVLLVPLVWLARAMPGSSLPLLLGAHLLVTVVQRAIATRDLPHMYYRDLWYPQAAWAIPPVLIALLLLRGTRSVSHRVSPPLRYWGAIFLAALVASALGHSTQWAFKNSLLPLAVLGVPFVVLVIDTATGLRVAPEVDRRNARWIAAALAVQLVAVWEPPMRHVPSADDRRGWQDLASKIAAMPGKVMVVGHPRLAFELGKGEHLHGMGFADLAGLGGVPDLDARLAHREWSAIVVDVDDGMGAPPQVAPYYRLAARFDAPSMKTGTLCRPGELWVPR